MNVFRLKTPLMAVSNDPRPSFIALDAGTIVHTPKAGPMLPNTGLVEVVVSDHPGPLAMFMQDLRERAEEVEPQLRTSEDRPSAKAAATG